MIYTVANTVQAGRPVRVFVNGNEVECVVFADSARGRVRYCPRPLRPKRNGDEVFTRVLRGMVTVEEKT
nr:hypothetical protein [uncultured Pseudomonas sp.]